MQITQVGYNAYGPDTIYNRNQEFVDVKADATAGRAVNVTGLVVADQWGKSHEGADDNPRGCNTYKVTSLPGITPIDGNVLLPAGHTIRVYSGAGTPSVSAGGTVHAVYMDSRCGYHGHIWGNGGDTAWITLGANSESFAYDFDNGYTVKP
ncbi:hypothetical protein ACIBQ6_22235 [Nonomuraea sp. NPDC049655]|uniref:hypothetical protein n=1 Tax=Nonomuraea sp. NPDC049655 TaxID=3364355 RepID=UPI0037A86CDB